MNWKFLIPVSVFLVISVAMGYALVGLNPKEIPSALIDRPAPDFDLPPVPDNGPGLSVADLRAGKVTLVNVFASWCVACQAEHPLLMQLSREGKVDIFGLNYKDEPAAAARWLARWGNPYTRTGMDRSDRVGIEFGVYGVPETFIIAPAGRIADKIIGPVSEDILQDRLIPLIEELGR